MKILVISSVSILHDKNDSSFDSQLCQDRRGQDRTGCDRIGQDRKGQDRTGQDGTGQDRIGKITALHEREVVSVKSEELI